MQELAGKTAVVTGAGSGIGRALARALAAEKCRLALVDIDAAGLEETRRLIAGVPVSTHLASVADRERMAALPAEIQAEHGAIHLLFNNAGITISEPFEDSSLERLELVIGVNLWGVLYGCHYFLPYLKQAGEAQIVNTSSMAGFLGLPNQASYSLTKAAVKSLSETLRVELAVHGIGVTSLHPGAIKTNIMKAAVRYGGDAEETARLEELVMRFGMAPEKLAVRAIRAVKRNRMRQRIGFDSYLMDWLKRLLPVAIHAPLRWAFARAARFKALPGAGAARSGSSDPRPDRGR
jgi:NAD(P)-dependent dehydrogenase (short-subunit alcohol dehydrogenase family)